MYKNFIKSILDFFLASIAIFFFSPVLVIVTIALVFQNKGNPFYFQERPGKNQKAFRIIKFKTMNDERDDQGNLLPDIDRITKFGKILRNFSIDELPQLINILNGEMSLIGPRPLLFKYIPLYSPDQLKRHEVKPGITGWAQVNGRNSISWTKKFQLDIYYVNHLSLKLDIKIFWFTILKVINREGINQSAERPMQPFNGNN